uniref:Uncharacterized protein n=1 Tax=Vitis vinifera TaxID=29760 RepID=A5BJZ0_VITVI|nr:hypothetical protein VITISV_037625 [Vitis vinifera]
MGALVIALGAVFLSLFFLEKSMALSLISDFCSDILSLAVLYYDSLEPGFRDQPPTPTPLLRSYIASNATPPPSPYTWRILGHCARSPLSLSHPLPLNPSLPFHHIERITVLPLVPGESEPHPVGLPCKGLRWWCWWQWQWQQRRRQPLQTCRLKMLRAAGVDAWKRKMEVEMRLSTHGMHKVFDSISEDCSGYCRNPILQVMSLRLQLFYFFGF